MARRDGVSVDVDRLRSVLAEHPVEFAVLFGSHARGEADAHSDVEIGVILEPMDDVRTYRRAIERLLADISSACGSNDVDLVDLTDVDSRVARHALADAVVLLGTQDRLEAIRKTHDDSSEGHSSFRDRLDVALERARGDT